jgi:hypothetical protein
MKGGDKMATTTNVPLTLYEEMLDVIAEARARCSSDDPLMERMDLILDPWAVFQGKLKQSVSRIAAMERMAKWGCP